MKCQLLYDIRELTGCVSGNDLHEIFRGLVGEPSPSGKKEITDEKELPEKFIELMKDKQLLTAIEDFHTLLARSYAANGFIDEARFCENQQIDNWRDLPEWAAKPQMKPYGADDPRFKYGYVF